jgi:hypothetical protein
MFEIIILPRPDRQGFAAGKSRFKSLLECRHSPGAFDHNQIIILPLEPGCGKVRGAGAQQPPIDLVAFEMHRGTGLVFDPNLA